MDTQWKKNEKASKVRGAGREPCAAAADAGGARCRPLCRWHSGALPLALSPSFPLASRAIGHQPLFLFSQPLGACAGRRGRLPVPSPSPPPHPIMARPRLALPLPLATAHRRSLLSPPLFWPSHPPPPSPSLSCHSFFARPYQPRSIAQLLNAQRSMLNAQCSTHPSA